MGDVGSKTTCHFSPFNLATCSGGERTARRKGGRSALTKLICLAAWLIQRTTGPGTTGLLTTGLRGHGDTGTRGHGDKETRRIGEREHVLLPTRYQPSGPEARARPSELLRGQTLLILYSRMREQNLRDGSVAAGGIPEPGPTRRKSPPLGFIRMPEPPQA
jgi:hypothetical protein